MIRLNLVPKTEKNAYTVEIARRFIVFTSIGFFIILMAFISLLSANYFFIYLQLTPEIERLETEKQAEKTKKVEEFEKQIKDINTKLNLISAAKTQATPISQIINKIIVASSGKNSYLTNIFIDKPATKASIKGFSLNRDQVVQIQENLKGEMAFVDINAPYSNLLKQVNINFSFDFKIKQ